MKWSSWQDVSKNCNAKATTITTTAEQEEEEEGCSAEVIWQHGV